MVDNHKISKPIQNGRTLAKAKDIEVPTQGLEPHNIWKYLSSQVIIGRKNEKIAGKSNEGTKAELN
jgi:hypothetical protein